MGEPVTTIGLIAGGRQFPVMVARGIKELGHRLVVACFTGHTNMDVVELADTWQELKLGKLSQLISFFKANGVSQVVMAGTINKPKVMDVRHLDMRAVKLLFKHKGKGDSAILGMLSEEFAREGMPVVPPQAIVPGLLTPTGLLTRRAPDEREREDLAFAWNIAKELGRMDVGQCVVAREGIIAAVEALEGTDATIRRGCDLGGDGCVVVKVFKPGQQEQIDLPSLGLDTIRVMREGGATCLGVEAGRSLFFDREQAIACADEAGIAIIGLGPDGFQES